MYSHIIIAPNNAPVADLSTMTVSAWLYTNSVATTQSIFTDYAT